MHNNNIKSPLTSTSLDFICTSIDNRKSRNSTVVIINAVLTWADNNSKAKICVVDDAEERAVERSSEVIKSDKKRIKQHNIY